MSARSDEMSSSANYMTSGEGTLDAAAGRPDVVGDARQVRMVRIVDEKRLQTLKDENEAKKKLLLSKQRGGDLSAAEESELEFLSRQDIALKTGMALLPVSAATELPDERAHLLNNMPELEHSKSTMSHGMSVQGNEFAPTLESAAARTDEFHPAAKSKSAEEDDGAEPPKAGGRPKLLSAFKFRDKTDTVLICLGIFFAVAQGILPPLNMIIFGSVINSLGYGLDMDTFNSMLADMGWLALAAFVCGFMNAACLETASERQIRRLKHEYIKAMLRQDIGHFDIVDTGTIASRIEQTCVYVRDGTGMKFGLVFQYGSQFIGGYIVALTKGWKMALVMSAVIPMIGSIVGVVVCQVRKHIQISKREYEKAGAVAEEALPVMRTVAAFGSEERIIERFNGFLDGVLASDRKGSITRAWGFAGMFLSIFLSYALGWWYAGITVSDAYVSSNGTDLEVGGRCLTVFFCTMIASFSVGQLTPNINSWTMAAKSAEDVHQDIARVSPIDPSLDVGIKPEKPLTGKIEFRNVQFAFPSRPDRLVYEDVSFTINPGEKIALVGPSGCGKSTIIQLIERFYDVLGGELLIDGVNVKDYNLQWLRSNMALVSQEPRLFAESIKRNILYGKFDATQEEIEQAAKQANAHNFIQTFVDGYETNVGEGGSLLSGGQKQRVAIARAVLRDPPILILDEATSALDNESEKIVQKALDELLAIKHATTIIIAHRLSTIRTADRIIVIDNPTGYGSLVVEQGTHEELMTHEKGLYRGLVNAQTAISAKENQGGLDDTRRSEAVMNISNQLVLDATTTADIQRELSQAVSVSRMLRKYSKDVSQTPRARGASVDHSLEADYRTSLHNSKYDLTNSKIPQSNPSQIAMEAAADTLGVEPLADVKIRTLFKFLKPDAWIVFAGCCGAVVVGGAFPCISILVAKFIDIFYSYDPAKTPQENGDYVTDQSNQLSLYFLAMASGVGIFAMVQQASFGFTGEGLVDRLRRLTFRSMVYQDMEFFDDAKNNTGTLSTVLSADCALIRGVTGDNLAIMVQNLMTFVIAAIIAFTADWKLAFVAISMFMLVVPANYWQNKNIRTPKRPGDNIHDVETAGYLMNETVTSLRTVAAYNLQDDIVGRYTKILDEECEMGTRNSLITGVTAAFAAAMMFAANAVSFKFGGWLWTSGKDPDMDQEIMMRTIMAIMMAGNSIGRNTAFATDTKKAKSAARAIMEIIDRKPKIDVRDTSGESRPIEKGSCNFETMRFRYPTRPDVPVLNDIGFTVSNGETVALVGESGCGKSTIIQLLERFYDLEASETLRANVRRHNEFSDDKLIEPDQMYHGSVTIDGKNIQEYNVRNLRECLGLVSQEPALFDTTVFENVRWGKREATDQEIEQALRMSNAWDFVHKLPDKGEERVGKCGGLLSGGQKQRVAIARAIIRDPKILLLDEATSALDPESEEIVQRALDDLLAKSARTTIVIAHRLSTIRNANKIVVFVPEPGVGSRIVEMGNHEELMKISGGVYRKLVELTGSTNAKQSRA